MYEDLMIDLDLCARGEKTGYHDVELCGLACSAIKSLTAQLAALQSENGSKDKCIARMEAERDAAVEENEFRKHTVLTPLYTCGGHGYGEDDDEDFWCPVCRQHLGTHRGFKTTCPRCGQKINSDGEPCWDYDELRRTEYDHLPKNWARGAQGEAEAALSSQKGGTHEADPV